MDKARSVVASLLSCLCVLSGPVSAEGILPVAQGRFSTTVFLNDTSAPPSTGAWVEFLAKDDKGVPKRIGVIGFVLGVKEDAVFIELTEDDAAQLAHVQTTRPVRFQKFADPDPEAVAERERHRDNAQPVTVAPRMRTVTVSIPVAQRYVADWTPGEVLTFPELGEVRWRPSVTGWGSRGLDIEAMFVSARQTGPDSFDVTLVAEPRDAFTLLKAEAENRLAVDPRGEFQPEAEADRRCYIRHRRGTDTEEIVIPCE